MDTSQELLYHVDGRDGVIGACRRGDAHRLGLRHRAVHILVFKGTGEIYLQKRALSKDCNPGLWDSSAAGHVDFGETYESCALRELAEELSIQLPSCPQNSFTLEASAENGWEFIRVYRLCWEGPVRPAPDEIEAGRWVSPSEMEARIAADDPMLTPSLKMIWRRFHRGPEQGGT